jgi:hypothetical protein
LYCLAQKPLLNDELEANNDIDARSKAKFTSDWINMKVDDSLLYSFLILFFGGALFYFFNNWLILPITAILGSFSGI